MRNDGSVSHTRWFHALVELLYNCWTDFFSMKDVKKILVLSGPKNAPPFLPAQIWTEQLAPGVIKRIRSTPQYWYFYFYILFLTTNSNLFLQEKRTKTEVHRVFFKYNKKGGRSRWGGRRLGGANSKDFFRYRTPCQQSTLRKKKVSKGGRLSNPSEASGSRTRCHPRFFWLSGQHMRLEHTYYYRYFYNYSKRL